MTAPPPVPVPAPAPVPMPCASASAHSFYTARDRTLPVLAELANERDGLIVTGCPRRPEATAFQRVQALTRASRNPVVIV